MEKITDDQTRTESKMRLVEQINLYLRSGGYSRALDSLRGAVAEFPDDAELSELEKLARDGVDRNAEANRLITESQELFAQRKSAEAIQLLHQAYELDKHNSRARAILANALVEHAISIVETNWWEAAVLSKQALELNPAHPTAKTIRSLIYDLKKAAAVEEWISQASKLQASGDLFAALSLIAEGLDVHSRDPKLLLLQDAIQRDQDARRRHARRGDLEDLRHMESEIGAAGDVASKRALAARIQAVAAKYWTDGEVISVANGLLQRLGLVQETATGSPRSKGAAVIFHVPRASAPQPSPVDTSAVVPGTVPASRIAPVPTPSTPAPQDPAPPAPSVVPPGEVRRGEATPAEVTLGEVTPSKVTASKVPRIVPPRKVPAKAPEPKVAPSETSMFSAAELSASAAKVTVPSFNPPESTRSNSRTLIFASAAAIILLAAIFFFARKSHAPAEAMTAPAASTIAAPAVSVPAAAAPVAVAPAVSAPAAAAPAQTTPEPSPPAVAVLPDSTQGKVAVADRLPADQPPAESAHNLGSLLVVAGQDDARVFLNGSLQRQLTHAGQLRVPNLELKDYVVQVSKNGFQDPPQQTIRIRNGVPAKLVFHLQPQNLLPQPRLASLTIQGGAPGTTVLIDQTAVGTIQPDGTLSLATVTPGDHSVELRKDRFKPRQFKKHFVGGGAISLSANEAALEAAPSEVKITFTPADAKVALVKGDLLTIVNSGVPLNLAAGTYTLTARTPDGVTRSSTLEVVAGQSKTLDLPLAPSGMSKWDDPGAWKHEKDSYTRKGGDFVLYGVVPASGTFDFSAMLTKGRLLQWVFNYTDSKNYVLFQMDDHAFYRTVVRNGEKTDEIIVPDKGDKKSFRTLHIRVSPTELVHQIRHGDSWTVLDRWTQPRVNLSQGKFGFYIPGDDQITLSSFAHYVDLNIR